MSEFGGATPVSLLGLSFLSVLNSNAGLYEDMKSSPLLSARDGYGSFALHLALKRVWPHFLCYNSPTSHPRTESAQKADQIYLPVLESAQKAERLRKVVSALERAKSWFRIGKVVWSDVREVSTLHYPKLQASHLRFLGTLRGRAESLQKGIVDVGEQAKPVVASSF